MYFIVKCSDLLLLNVLGKLRKKLKSLKKWATDCADNEDALKINLGGDSSVQRFIGLL